MNAWTAEWINERINDYNEWHRYLILHPENFKWQMPQPL